MVEQARLPHPVEVLEQDAPWMSHDARLRLFEAAVEVLDQPDALFRVGVESLRDGRDPALVVLLRGLGSPAQAYRLLPRSGATCPTTCTVQVLECGSTRATVEHRLAAELGLQVVVEGVETEEQPAVLHQVGCRLVQGHLLGRPAAGFPAQRGRAAAGP